MKKRYVATGRNDRLMQVGRNKWDLFYGYGTDGETGWCYYKRFTHKPSYDELKECVVERINANVQEKILSGFEWDGMKVWLSSENQYNYKAAYDLAVQTEGASLPVTFKFGTDDEPIYEEFTDVESLKSFYTAMVAHIQSAVSAGWEEKDEVASQLLTLTQID